MRHAAHIAGQKKYNKYKHQGGHEYVALLCNTLEQHGEKPEKVLRIDGLAVADWNKPAAVTALFMAATSSQDRSLVTLTPTMTMQLQLPLNLMIVNEYVWPLWGAYLD